MSKKTGKKYEKLRERTKDVIEEVGNIAEDVVNFVEKMKNFLETTNRLSYIGSLSNYPLETQKFNEDLEKYGLGVFLLLEKENPIISDIFGKCGFLPNLIKIRDIKLCIDEYYQFIELARKKEKNLIELELKESKEFFNNNHLDPIKNLTQKSYMWHKIEEKTLIHVNSLIKTLPSIQIYVNILAKVIRIEMVKFNRLKARRGSRNQFKLTQKIAKRINTEFYKKCPENIIKEIKVLGKSGEEITTEITYIKKHKIQTFYFVLELAKDLYEFHIDFVKFLLRIWHIYESGNRDYVNNYKIEHNFPNINSIMYFYINRHLDKYCPNLSRILMGFFLPFEKYRHIESHSSPNLDLSDDENFIFIPQKGKNHKLKVNIGYLKTLLRTYQAIIEALNIYD